MEEEKGTQESAGMQESTEAAATEDSNTPEDRRGPTWRGWVLSILAAVILSVTATLLLGGSFAGRPEGPMDPGAAGSGCGGPCCPPAIAGK
jgi:hypothetical protein